jgi:DNA-binding transcriptional LysR family regulator
MELRHLRYFITVAKEQSFSRAADRLQMAQPPLSKQIQDLEKELEVKLFDRSKRPLQLTPAGQILLEETRATLTSLEQAIHKTQQMHRGELAPLTIGFTSSIANGILPNILREFRKAYPEIKVILREENSVLQLQRLRDRQVDVIFVYHTPALAGVKALEMMSLSQERLIAVLPQHHPLAMQTKISLIDLSGEEFVMPLRSVVAGLPEKIDALCRQAGFVPKVAQEGIYLVTILGLVAGGMGVSLLPSSVQNLHRKGVVYRPLKEASTINQLTAIWQQNDSSIILRQFLDIAKMVSNQKSDAFVTD